MQQGKSSKFKWFVRVIVLGVIVWFVWSLFGLHVTESHGPITAANAESLVGVTVPPEATNIRAASYSQWIEYAEYLRFEAPVDICRQFASTVVPTGTTRPADEFDLAQESKTPRADAFEDFSWFDLDKAQDVFTVGGGPSQPQVWVDQRRGVVYYRKMD